MEDTSPSPRLFRSTPDAGLEPLGPGGDAGPALCATNAALQAFVSHSAYPCVGAKAALARRSYVLAVYPSLTDPAAAFDTAADLRWFGRHADEIDTSFATFLAVFAEAGVTDDEHFEAVLWQYLQAMHHADAPHAAWDPSVSRDPGDPDFRFSIGGSGFFVIGMHPNAGREARRFPFPTMVFNLHTQFERLRAEGRYERMRTLIRAREETLAGEPNPVLADHGTSSEAEQYAGVAHPPGWTPPFRPVPQTSNPSPHPRTEGSCPYAHRHH